MYMTSILNGSAIKRALLQVVTNQLQLKSGLYVPEDYIAGKHYGGFGGYAEWIQDCIRTCCKSVRGVGLDELSEVTALAMWQKGAAVEFVVAKHADVLVMFDEYGARIADMTGEGGLSAQVREQVRRVDGSRERGTLMVVCMNPVEAAETGKLMACVSAWNPATIEEAAHVPKQRYVLG